MNRLKAYFENKNSKDTLNIYFTAGFPSKDDTLSIIKTLDASGADIIELGIPFSDPLADGPTIQQSSEKALANGMTIKLLFEQLTTLRKETQIPIVMMGYLNPVIQYGVEKFIQDAAKVGIDGFIFPDLPLVEFKREWIAELEKNDLTFSFLITPETPKDRIIELDKNSSGFLYAVISSSTTGSAKTADSEEKTKTYLDGLKELDLTNPVLAGFGIKDNAMYQKINSLCDGAIIGSAFIKHLNKNGAASSSINEFVSSIKG
jgi:tryptophan synthase alpha chain